MRANASPGGWAVVDDAIQAQADAAFAFLERGDPPRRLVMGSTTDARFYLNQFSRPALACGPKARNIHAVDEAVELAGIVRGADPGPLHRPVLRGWRPAGGSGGCLRPERQRG